MVARRKLKARGKPTTSEADAAAARLSSLFGPPLLLEGEDAAAYDQLLARVCEAVKPVDIIDEMFIANIIFLEWQVWRWRRLKLSLIQARGLEALKSFLIEQIDYDSYSEHLTRDLTDILRDNLPEDEAESAETLLHRYGQDKSDAVDKVNKILEENGQDIDHILNDAKAKKAKELVQEYMQREPGAVTEVDELLSNAGMSIDTLMANALAEKLNDVERIDHLATIAESRRNASLREIDRRRAALGETLRRSVQGIEHAELKLIETTTPKGKSAA
jgi:F0F1-type ATP synthase membrane subunit b/b'